MKLRLPVTIALCIGLLCGSAHAQQHRDFVGEAQQAYDRGDYLGSVRSCPACRV